MPRILSPIVHVVDSVASLVESAPGVREYVDGRFGGVDGAIGAILGDFFRRDPPRSAEIRRNWRAGGISAERSVCRRHGFDGSGADNYYDAGSCIDGRLTSAWNWCSKLSRKPYYHLFMMCGFVGFDGSFSK